VASAPKTTQPTSGSKEISVGKHPLAKFSTTARMLVDMELGGLDAGMFSIAELKSAIKRAVDRIKIGQCDGVLDLSQHQFAALQKDYDSAQKISDPQEREVAFNRVREKIEKINKERNKTLSSMREFYSGFLGKIKNSLGNADHAFISGSDLDTAYYRKILEGDIAAGEAYTKDLSVQLGPSQPSKPSRLPAGTPVTAPPEPAEKKLPPKRKGAAAGKPTSKNVKPDSGK